MMDNDALHKKLCDIEELLQMVFKTQEWNVIGGRCPDERQWVIVVDSVHEQPVESQYVDGKFYYGDHLSFELPDDYHYWLPMERGNDD